MLRIIIISIILLSGIVSHAQRLRTYDYAELTCGRINAMVQDSDGFIWIATENGLNRFDGWKMKYYLSDQNDSTALCNNFVGMIYVDNDDRLWVGSGSGLQRYSSYSDAFENVNFTGGEKPSVMAMKELSNGEMWVVTNGYGIYRINPVDMRADRLTEINSMFDSEFMLTITEDSYKRIWITTNNQRISYITPDRSKIVSVNSPGMIRNITVDILGNIWCATRDDIYYWDEAKSHFCKIELTGTTIKNISEIISLCDGTLYIVTRNSGVWQLKDKQQCPTIYFHEWSYSADNLYKCLFDSKNRLWLGYHKSGIAQLSSNPFRFSFEDITPSIDQYLTGIAEDSAGRIWVSTNDGNMRCYTPDMHLVNSLSIGKSITGMTIDHDDMIWTVSSDGIINRVRKDGRVAETYEVNNRSYLSNVIEGNDRRMYVATIGSGFLQIANGKIVNAITSNTQLATDKSLYNDYIMTLYCDSNGFIWIGHCDGIDCYDPYNNRMLDLDCSEALKSHVVYALASDHYGRMWIGTSKGMYVYDVNKSKLAHYYMSDGLPSNMVCGLNVADNGDVWFSTYKGLGKLNASTGAINAYISGNGLVDTEYIKSVYLKSSTGRMYFGGLRGVSYFIPDVVLPGSEPGCPVLTNLYINNEQISADTYINGNRVADNNWSECSQINLDLEHNSLVLEFSTFSFDDRETIQFEFRIPEINDSWQTLLIGDNKVMCNYLPSGKYHLEVRANENGVYSPVRKFNISIAPPWYASNTAIIMYLFLVIALISLTLYVYRRQLNRKKKEEVHEERFRSFINIAHELRSPLSLIVSPLSSLIKSETDSKKKKALITMSRSASRIENLVNQILDIRKIEKGQMKLGFIKTDVVILVKNIVDEFEYVAAERHINLSFEHDKESLFLWIDPHNFDKIIINLIANAFKFTPDNGIIKVTITSDEQEAKIIVEDSGIGLDEGKINKIFERFYQASNETAGYGIGLHLTKMLVDLHHGRLTAENRKEENGSRFIVIVPCGKGHLSEKEIINPIQTNALHERPVILRDNIVQVEKPNSHSIKRKPRLLIVDDDEDILMYLQTNMSIEYKVLTAKDGIEAFNIAQTSGVDLIVSDVMMPRMDGFELLKRLKSNSRTSIIPIILLTTRAEYETRIKGWDIGAEAFISKPFKLEELLLLCENLINGRIKLKGRLSVDKDIQEKIQPVKMKSNDDIFMDKLTAVINENISNSDFKIEDLADNIGMSRVTLHRRIKNLTGISPVEFVRNIRLAQAAKLLRSCDTNISQVAYAVGFSNPGVFSTAFKNQYGYTPSDYAELSEEQVNILNNTEISYESAIDN